VANGPYQALPHLAVTMSAAGSSDPDGDALTYAWSFGDGGTASGVAVTHAYAGAGTYTVRLIVTDVRGLADTAFTTATVLTQLQAIQNAALLIDPLVASGVLDASDGKWIGGKLDLALKLLGRQLDIAAVNQLDEVVRRLVGDDTATLRNSVRSIIESVTLEE
jgi:PKD repeat protein